MGHDQAGPLGYATLMLLPCSECSHPLWSELRRHGSFRFVVYFDDDERSASYTEHVLRCPRCGENLSRQAIEHHDLTTVPRRHRIVTSRS